MAEAKDFISSWHKVMKNYELDDLPECFCDMELDWNNNDNGGFPFFAIGANYLCDSIATCVAESDNFELSLDQFYYSFPVLSPQNCDSTTANLEKSDFPYQYHVSAPYPNPFNPTVNIDINTVSYTHLTLPTKRIV